MYKTKIKYEQPLGKQENAELTDGTVKIHVIADKSVLGIFSL